MNPVTLITGASRGIGRAIAIALAETGYDVVINYASNVRAAEETKTAALANAQQHGKTIRAEICQADISRSEDRIRLIDFIREKFGRLDLLVNNAGIAPSVRADILDATETSFDQLITVNLKGPYFLTQLVAKWMIEQQQQEGSRRPKIVTISSISAYTASVNRGDYCISKAGLAMMTKLFASRLAEHGINVYEIRPGITATDMTTGVKEKYDRLIAEGVTPIKRWGHPEDVAKAVVAIALDLLPFSTGEVINVDGGFHLQRL
ncbi:MAG: 3-ketoacyl-ACP reductase [candidate division KSB1 bacterium]|nr:3-ketoacyl-ACP reductase [candidate division KSB1 bacterium]MDZ7303263.1 3-ketoacyl-ACP reductase [candidate division KSB1 bacterium]MDZ7312567.1 3-ketoacyl-ACP reductase [candidate division KSB1 bacterium]